MKKFAHSNLTRGYVRQLIIDEIITIVYVKISNNLKIHLQKLSRDLGRLSYIAISLKPFDTSWRSDRQMLTHQKAINIYIDKYNQK